MRLNHETPPGKLYHRTSGSAAEQIVLSGGICPPASSPELASRYLLPKASRRPDPRYVYLIPTSFEAIMFGVVRAVRYRNTRIMDSSRCASRCGNVHSRDGGLRDCVGSLPSAPLWNSGVAALVWWLQR
jgi:hypothetical protein